MKSRQIFLILAIFLSSVFLSSCGSSVTATSWPGLTVDEEFVYVSYATGIYAVRLDNGLITWRYPAEANNNMHFYAAPALGDGQLFVGDYQKTFYGINSTNGSELWKFPGATDRWIASPLIVGETILAPSADSHLYALDLSGKLLWKFASTHAFWGRPVVEGETVYIPGMDHFLYALDLKTGQEKWKLDLGGAVVSSPVLNDSGILFIGTMGREVLAVDTASHSILWRYSTTKEVWGTPVLHEESLYLADLGGTVYALNTADGNPDWNLPLAGSISGSGALAEEGIVFTTDAGNVVMVSFDGVQRWTQAVEGKLYGTPVVAGDLVVVGVTGGEDLLAAFDVNGTPKWKLPLPK